MDVTQNTPFPSTLRVEPDTHAAPTEGSATGGGPGPVLVAGAAWEEFPDAVRQRYTPRGLLGEGGMGLVFEAWDEVLQRPVAIKGPRGTHEATLLLEMFAREVRTAARLAHPNILPVFDTWIDRQGRPWCSMLRVPGAAPSLAGLLDGLEGVGPESRDLGRLFDIFRQICRGVAHAHEKGLVHRDLKPENVLLGSHDEAFVADWGLADVARASDAIVGTLFYAPPEQLGKNGPPRADARADVHALGAILVEMLAGRKKGREILGDTARMTRPGERAFPARVPRELAAIVLRAVAADPADRFPDVMSLVAALDVYENGGLVEGLSYSRGERLGKWFRNNPAKAAALVVGILGATAFLWSQEKAGRELRASAADNAWIAAHAYQSGARLAKTRESTRLAEAYADRAMRMLPSGRQLVRGQATATAIRPRAKDPLMWTVRLESNVELVRFVTDEKGLTIFAGTSQGWLWRWRWPGGERVLRSRFLEGFPWGVAVNPRGDWLAAGSKEGIVRVYAITPEGVELRHRLEKAHAGPLWSLDFGAESDVLITGGFDRRLMRWTVSGASPTLLGESEDQIYSVAAGSGRRRAVSADIDDRLRVHPVDESSTTTGTLLVRPPGNEGSHVSMYMKISPDDRWLASGAPDGAAEVWDLDHPDVGPTRYPIAESRAAGIFDFGPGNTILAAGDTRGRVHLFERAKPGPPFAILASSSEAMLSALDISPDGRYLAAGGQDTILSVYDLERVVKDPPPRIECFSLLPGSRVALGRDDGHVEILPLAQVEKGTAASEVTSGTSMSMASGPTHLAAPPDGRWLAAITAERELAIWTTAPVSETCRRIQAEGVDSLAASDDGRWLAGGGTDSGITVWAVPSGEAAARVDTGVLPVQALVYRPGTRSLIYSTSGGQLFTGNPLANEKFVEMKRPDGRSAHDDGIQAIAVDPAGSRLASGGIDLIVRLWDLRGRDPPRELSPPLTSHMYSCAFDHTGRRLVTADMNKAISVWDVESGERILTLQSESARMHGTLFDDRGRLLVAGGTTVELLDIPRLGRLDEWIAPRVEGSMFVPGDDPTELVPRAADLALPPD